MKYALIALCALLLAGCPTLGNVEGFALVKTPEGSPAFACFVRGDVQTGFLYYGVEGDAGLRDAATKFRFTLPPGEDLKAGEMRYWDKKAGVDERVPIGTELPAWVAGLMLPDEVAQLGLTFAPMP